MNRLMIKSKFKRARNIKRISNEKGLVAAYTIHYKIILKSYTSYKNQKCHQKIVH